MPARNYYLVLGVSRDGSPAAIRAAYQEFTLRLDPGTAALQEITEAYAVLSDPERRRAHDREFEPPPAPPSLLSQPEDTHPSFDAFRDRYLRNFTGRGVPKAERAESLTLDVVVSPEEAFRGCTIPVGVPVFRSCPECGGAGYAFPFRCVECAGSGLVEERRTLRIEVPPRVRSGTVLESPLDLFGIANLYLRLHVAISNAA